MKTKIFISYAREDYGIAKKLYDDLKAGGVDPWMDKFDLLPGQKWKSAVSSAIKSCQYFLLLLSSTSVSKQGFVHKEMRLAVEVLDSLPESDIFIIPARMDDCRPSHEILEELQWVDLFPSYETGLKDILRVVKSGRKVEVSLPNSGDENRESPVSPDKQKSEIRKENSESPNTGKTVLQKKTVAVKKSKVAILGDGAKVDGGIHIHNYNIGNIVIGFIVLTVAIYLTYLLVSHMDWKQFVPPTPKQYSLTVTTDPADAKVRIADPEMVYSPGVKLRPGIYQIEVSHPDFKAERRQIEIKEEDVSESVKLVSSVTAPVTEPFTNSIGMKFVYIKPGTFMMGSPKEEQGRENDETQHEVTLTKGCYMQTTEVTVGQWRTFAKAANYKSAYVLDGKRVGDERGLLLEQSPFFPDRESSCDLCFME